jgi:hypothetical protein
MRSSRTIQPFSSPCCSFDLIAHFREKLNEKNSRFFEIARELVRRDHIASFIVNANHSIV